MMGMGLMRECITGEFNPFLKLSWVYLWIGVDSAGDLKTSLTRYAVAAKAAKYRMPIMMLAGGVAYFITILFVNL